MAAEVRLAEACAEVIHAKADLSGTEALIAHLLKAIHYKRIRKDKIELHKRSAKGQYADQRTIRGMNFVAERY